MHVALLLGQENKEVLSIVLHYGTTMGFFLLWGLDVPLPEICGLCVFCLLVTLSIVSLHMLPLCAWCSRELVASTLCDSCNFNSSGKKAVLTLGEQSYLL